MTRSTGNTACHQTAPRLFVGSALRQDAAIACSAEQAHYLGTVLRRDSGDVVRLFNGVDGEWAARLTLARRNRSSREATLAVETLLRPQQPEAGAWLLFALLKRDATDLVVRQAVELGASRVLPVITERTNAARVNDERLRAIAIEAAEQSERLTIPVIDAPTRLEAILAAWPKDRRLFAALERYQAKATEAGIQQQQAGQSALLVGPEGGFTPAEHEMLRRLDFVTPISLGPFVLRAETAAAAGQALLLAMDPVAQYGVASTGWAEYLPST
jgi:16S rRNA (uracil1498-N3)-methyltransferase